MVDEDALLEQFAAQFAHDPGDLDDTAGLQDNNDVDGSEAPATFDTTAFLNGLDDIFNRHAAETEAGPYLEQAAVDAENAGDEAGLLTVLNETMGFYRSQGRHKENQWIVQRAIELALHMGLEGSEVWATTLINCATAMRAAKQYDQAEDLYAQALACAQKVYPANDRRLAALHNNLSMLYSETNRLPQAEEELSKALTIIEASSVNPQADIDVASSHTNLALVLLQEGKLEDAHTHAAQALTIYATGKLTHSAHYASALAGFAQVLYAEQRYSEAVDHYRKALAVIAECYGTDTDYYRITAENLREAEAKAGSAADTASAGDTNGNAATLNGTGSTATAAASGSVVGTADDASDSSCPISGLKLAREFFNQVGKPMIVQRYPDYAARIAAGLVGHGSECYGFDDRYSQDHDFGPRFCLWLNDEDYAAIGKQLQADYDALPRDFMVDGQGAVHFTGTADAADDSATADSPATQHLSPTTPRAQGANRRDGVFRIGEFFTSITGYAAAPVQDAPHEWLMLDEATLAAATNGAVFQDPTGDFSSVRQGFKDMPDDVRLSLISKRLGMIAQAGQYNLPRSLKRGDGAAAWLSINEFVNATASLVFLINKPLIVGYLPYYKWQFAALRKLSGSMFALLPDICEQLETVMRLSSAACFGGAGFGEGGKGAAPAADSIANTVEHIADEIVKELQREGLTTSSEAFLEWQRPYVEEHIQSNNPVLRSL
ncbi:DUF4037 domain-containing protein [Bifidobacterium cebidarum]|uniref:Tetratricopeptide repeat protein n=1 Tax=Bifidobacterium cebidarum TaxID=2650773 RepID=A0A6I1GCK4_9BIFI|nr:DUF4037 domain-containing protein [Bifidobacterium cebidarum]KAB7789255.1 tetratricopeptide repeat protein [Bifidobacterium cebidarum]